MMAKTERGFDLIEFKDSDGNQCTIQKSSSAKEDKVWIGISSAQATIFASEAAKQGYPTNAGQGWIDFYIPEEVIIPTKMLLNKKQAASIINTLQKFVNTGDIT